jgi:hypothetical protein
MNNIKTLLDDLQPNWPVQVTIYAKDLAIQFARLPDPDLLKDLAIVNQKPGFIFDIADHCFKSDANILDYQVRFPGTYDPAQVAAIFSAICEQHGLAVMTKLTWQANEAIYRFNAANP